jgi:hypothetical protein
MQQKHKEDKRVDRISKRTKTLITVDTLLTKDEVSGVIAELIKDQTKITDLIVIYRARNGKLSCVTTEMEFERMITLVDHIKFKMHEAQSAMEDNEEDICE